MIKTSTPKNQSNFANKFPAESRESVDQQNDLFYDYIKPSLNELVRNPSAEAIDKILAYAKAK